MRTLVLIRHAKAEQDVGDDRSRGLTLRGQADATAVSRWLTQEGIVPDRVVVSTARRTRETWALAGQVTPVYDERLYEGTPEQLREVVAETDPAVQTLVVVGHNPGVERLAWELDDSPAARDVTDQGLPTSSVVVLDVADWDLTASAVRKVATPRG